MKKLVIVAASLAVLATYPAVAMTSSQLYLPVNGTSSSVGLPDLPPAQLLQAPAPTSASPQVTPSFSDRVTNCIQSFTLNSGIGNNPTDRDSYVRQCAN